MEVPLRTAYGQNGHCGMQPKPTQSSRAGASKHSQEWQRNPQCSRRQRIDEVDIIPHVAIDQRYLNCLEEAVRSFIVMPRYRFLRADVTFRRR
ncbi:hypothetical protein TNCV_668831 [Trichonephila clavipes]|nr:hypothetical protein TNCV_668831 [Trichonephila clavipes]